MNVSDLIWNFLKGFYHCLGDTNALKGWKWCSETPPFVGELPRWCGAHTAVSTLLPSATDGRAATLSHPGNALLCLKLLREACYSFTYFAGFSRLDKTQSL